MQPFSVMIVNIGCILDCCTASLIGKVLTSLELSIFSALSELDQYLVNCLFGLYVYLSGFCVSSFSAHSQLEGEQTPLFSNAWKEINLIPSYRKPTGAM